MERGFDKYDVTKIFPIIQNRTNNTIEEIKHICNTEDMGNPVAVKGIVTWHRDADYYNAGSIIFFLIDKEKTKKGRKK